MTIFAWQLELDQKRSFGYYPRVIWLKMDLTWQFAKDTLNWLTNADFPQLSFKFESKFKRI